MMAANGHDQINGKPRITFCNRHLVWTMLLLISILCYTPWLFWSSKTPLYCPPTSITTAATESSRDRIPWSGDLRDLETRWNDLSFQDSNPQRVALQRLRIALFVKKWPTKDSAGGLERHARTLHRELARRGHEIHVFTSSSTALDRVSTEDESRGLHFHFSNPTPAGNLKAREAWEQFLRANETLTSEGFNGGFDIIHTESVALPHGRARNFSNVVVSWHGIAYETIQSDIVQDLMRSSTEARPLDLHNAITERVQRVIEEVKFFTKYTHHVATSDAVGEILRTVYMLPLRNVHIIVNGVDEGFFRPAKARGAAFRLKYGVPPDARLVLGMAGRLVKDKGHPLVFEVLKTLLQTGNYSDVFVLIAGDGPWGSRYRELAPNVKVVGPLTSAQLGDFYNALDIFVNPTLRAQGLDHTLMEAMLCGKPLLASHFSSITKSVVVSGDFGYTFSPRLESLRVALVRVIEDGKWILEKKGAACRSRAQELFTAVKMASAYERLFLCIARGNATGFDFCKYPFPLRIAH